nr:O-antigen ligase family protein [Desulfobacterales bacterium]
MMENRFQLQVLNVKKSILEIPSKELVSGIIEYSLLIYIFTQPFVHHTATIQAVSLATALLLWLIKIFCFGEYGSNRNRASIFLIIYTFVVILSILFGVERLISIKAFKSDIAKQLILYAIVINETKTIKQIKSVLYVMVFSISLLMLASLYEYITLAGNYGGFYQYIYKTNKGTIISNFAELSIFYYPVSVLSILVEKRVSLRITVAVSILFQVLFISLSGSRTALINVVFVSILFPLVLKRYRTVLGFVLGFLALLYFVDAFYPEMNYKAKYAEVFSLSTYLNSNAVSDRLPTWKASFKMWKERPFLGYGYGWKKFTRVCQAKGYENLLTNPHNLVLSLLFESGVFGLASFVLFIVVVFTSLFNNYKMAVSDDHRMVLMGVMILLASTTISSLTMSPWSGPHGKLMMVMIGLGLAKLKGPVFTNLVEQPGIP